MRVHVVIYIKINGTLNAKKLYRFENQDNALQNNIITANMALKT